MEFNSRKSRNNGATGIYQIIEYSREWIIYGFNVNLSQNYCSFVLIIHKATWLESKTMYIVWEQVNPQQI